MLRNRFPIKTSYEIDEDNWTLSILFDHSSNITKLVVQGLCDNERKVQTMYFHTWTSEIQLRTGTNHLDWTTEHMTYPISRRAAEDLIKRVQEESKGNDYKSKFNLDDPIKAGYAWARRKLLSAVHIYLTEDLATFRKLAVQPDVQAMLKTPMAH